MTLGKITLRIQLVKMRRPFGLSYGEAKLVRELLEGELKMIPDWLRDPGYTAKEQRVHRQYQRDCRNLLKRIRRLEAH